MGAVSPKTSTACELWPMTVTCHLPRPNMSLKCHHMLRQGELTTGCAGPT